MMIIIVINFFKVDIYLYDATLQLMMLTKTKIENIILITR